MSAPVRILRCPLHGSAAQVSRTATCPAPSPWRAPPAIERRHSSEAPAHYLSTTSRLSRASPLPSASIKNLATLQNRNPPPKLIHDPALFTSHPPLLSPEPGNNKPPDERKVKLGNTLRILQAHLPTLLQSPPPQGILSPRITLHLFPSTHPHLPTVSGRVAYAAALWSSPIAWNRVPLVGNVRLQILSERMVDSGAGAGASSPYDAARGGYPGGRRAQGACGEQLIVRWRTVGGGGRKMRGWLGFWGDASDGDGGGGGVGEGKGLRRSGEGMQSSQQKQQQQQIRQGEEESGSEFKAPVGMAQPARSSDKEFTGLFIFDFDEEGRILNHTIEHMQESGQWEKGVGAKVVGLTDWLLGGIKGGEAPCPAFTARFKKERS